VGTANFINPHATIDIIEGIEAFLVENNMTGPAEIIGTLKV
jgi:dihydroorotate dehydrogenase (NAD+) catalytic subunit